MHPDRIESRTASLCADLGIPTDNLGCGVVDLMIERRRGNEIGELRLMVAEDGESVTLCTVSRMTDRTALYIDLALLAALPLSIAGIVGALLFIGV